MDDENKPDPGTEFSAESSWPLGGDSESVYFFGSDRESSILSEFGWNLQPEESYQSLDRIDADEGSGLAGSLGMLENSSLQGGSEPAVRIGPVEKAGGDASTSNPSVSSSSSEDPAEKSTGSGGKPPEIP